MRSSLLAFTLALGSLVAADSIDHDKVVGFEETIPTGTTGDVYQAYQPYLKVVNGCVPFPAVDASGNTNAGLNPSGAPSADCASSTGQVYVRSGASSSGDAHALLYAWYFPKDSPSTGLGHRHDWEGVIVWLSDAEGTSADNVIAVCPSAHGGWDCSTDGYSLQGTRPLIKYESVWPVNHQCGLTSTVGGEQPLVAWESLSEVVQAALEDTDFGDANVPFKDANFENNLGKATY
ncbi:putative NPP1 domain protein [Aspergillus steynii IBT 23096]|uniref:Putative NPP1 domain protein n=1 Tax=Aspergillus steynii IBT 23096 TaxID=1392250 RepID=A0A2I2GAC3_9EURO|nr:putative NPP1 domain protein [Aspergillus steynii IBT 23096]PLB49831.1 putative NPP1 domain protein [Aspergillus steynii IBT 23096]